MINNATNNANLTRYKDFTLKPTIVMETNRTWFMNLGFYKVISIRYRLYMIYWKVTIIIWAFLHLREINYWKIHVPYFHGLLFRLTFVDSHEFRSFSFLSKPRKGKKQNPNFMLIRHRCKSDQDTTKRKFCINILVCICVPFNSWQWTPACKMYNKI